ncbi:Elongator subunit elp4 [Emydomyces testavorans]|uniref:Elongator complex protein 4 n=1 Tax=Emydomyces testavorans TaxID=2070801 RepID=A0AAF0DFQ2_9EURO|nr:Elongator subunit elp4 [Emydomyces testavorans]
MSFRKRNIGLSAGIQRTTAPKDPTNQPTQATIPGLRPSPIDGRPTTSTGTPTLDNLLAGHTGLALGSSLLIEESGTTDFAGALLRYYAAEGIVQEQQIHVVGLDPQWAATLPGLIGTAEAADAKPKEKGEKMKIAWRYERLGNFGTGIAPSRVPAAVANKNANPSTSTPAAPAVFCHAFDLTKRLTHPGLPSVDFIQLSTPAQPGSPFSSVIQRLSQAMSNSPPHTIHRVIVPSLLSPALYPPQASKPEYVLQFLHYIRALLSTHSDCMTAMITLPLSLYPRSTGLVRWIEYLSDGVIELAPFPHSAHSNSSATSGAATAGDEPPQGMLKIHRLPVFHERGGGADKNTGEDWAFTFSRRKFTIKPFSLPPVDGDNEAQQHDPSSGKGKADLEF